MQRVRVLVPARRILKYPSQVQQEKRKIVVVDLLDELIREF